MLSHGLGCKSEIKVLAGLAPSGAVRESLFCASPPASGGSLTSFGVPRLEEDPRCSFFRRCSSFRRSFGVPRLEEASPDLCLHVRTAFFLCACVCVRMCPFYEDLSHIGLGLH